MSIKRNILEMSASRSQSAQDYFTVHVNVYGVMVRGAMRCTQGRRFEIKLMAHQAIHPLEQRLAASGQATESRELHRHIRTGDCVAAAHADQLVLEFVVKELTEPPAAQQLKIAGDGYFLHCYRCGR
ncbi:hypothetical protein KIN20_030521 [Parelaphostrongylus tenuis]|uniref:Uncharacterized protein n=1 Tax=Parelaphostrongylus tenuis TaxID=148309 RepID=A0AAD5R465_PARTN|nr:hypothetical protein KIN20_030521 [Parelaphostrongylus tenuis]